MLRPRSTSSCTARSICSIANVVGWFAVMALFSFFSARWGTWSACTCWGCEIASFVSLLAVEVTHSGRVWGVGSRLIYGLGSYEAKRRRALGQCATKKQRTTEKKVMRWWIMCRRHEVTYALMAFNSLRHCLGTDAPLHFCGSVLMLWAVSLYQDSLSICLLRT